MKCDVQNPQFTGHLPSPVAACTKRVSPLPCWAPHPSSLLRQRLRLKGPGKTSAVATRRKRKTRKEKGRPSAPLMMNYCVVGSIICWGTTVPPSIQRSHGQSQLYISYDNLPVAHDHYMTIVHGYFRLLKGKWINYRSHRFWEKLVDLSGRTPPTLFIEGIFRCT